MSRSNSFASLGASRERQFSLNEHFRLLPASLGAISETRLQQQRRRLSIRDSSIVISTAIAENGWLATATSSDIRLYDLDSQDQTREVQPNREFTIPMQSRNERIRAIAISVDLLVVVTHYRLIVYEYRESSKALEDVRIDQNEAWVPKSISILQVESHDTFQSATAWVTVGGEGVNGVKLFQYSRITCWSSQSNFRTILKCRHNTGSVRIVGFSRFVHTDQFIVFGVTSDDRIFCWKIHPYESACPVAVKTWELDDAFSQNPRPHRAEIASISIFEPPSGRPYVFCAVNQKQGSQAPRSFIAPLERSLNEAESHWRPLPDNVAGRHVLTGGVTSNGMFLVIVEQDVMKLLTLRGAYEGGLTCLEHTLDWRSLLKDAAKDVSGIALSIRERRGGLDVVATDGRGHLLSARISIPSMPVSAPLSLARRPSAVAARRPSAMTNNGQLLSDTALRRPSAVAVELVGEPISELAGESILRELSSGPIVRELSAVEMRRDSARPAHEEVVFQTPWDRIEDEIKSILR